MSRRISDQVTTWIEEALDVHLLGDTATFEVSVMIDQQNGPVLLVVVIMPSPLLGQVLQVVGGISLSVTAEQIDGFVQEALESMRSERSRQMGLSGPQTASPAPSGLLVPGRG